MTNGLNSLEIARYFDGLFDFDAFRAADRAMNGLQVANSGRPISKIAFAVDACLENFKRASAMGAGMLFVHHGLFWGEPLSLTGTHRARIEYLMSQDLALYAVHLPLDQHPELGNNISLANLVGIERPEPFGEYHGKKIGYKGTLREPLTCAQLVERIQFKGRAPLSVLSFGKELNATCAVISGGAARECEQAIAAGVDAYVTGEASHEMYHQVLEAGVNYIGGGHYATEVWGVRSVMERCFRDTGLEVAFIDSPTGL